MSTPPIEPTRGANGLPDTRENSGLRLGVLQLEALPQALTPIGRYWIPSEPLAGDDVTASGGFNEPLAAAGVFAALTENPKPILKRLEEISTDAIADRLSEVLAALDRQDFDVMVLPEYCLPIDALPLLQGYSADRLIVAGLGLVRNMEIARNLVQSAGTRRDAEALVGKNVTAVIHNKDVHLVTKLHLAENEAAVSGHGPELFEVEVAGRAVRIVVAVCLDYLRATDRILQLEPDVVCVPAFSSNSAPFRPDAPRDFVRLFANAAQYGGSTVFSPSLRGPSFTDQLGVKPLPRTCEGVVVIRHDKYRSVPTGLIRSENRLLTRGQIVERPAGDTPTGIALQLLKELVDPVKTSTGEVSTQISRVLSQLGDSPGPIRDSLEEYRRILAQETSDAEMQNVLGTHIATSTSASMKTIRQAQAEFVTRRLREFVSTGAVLSNVGSVLDAYQALRPAPAVPFTAYARSTDRWSFGLRLGTYDSDSAVRTLPRQLNFLRGLSSLPPSSIEVTYRLSTEASARGPELDAFFDVLVTGDPMAASREEVEAQLRSMFVASWPTSATPDVSFPADSKRFVEIHLPEGTSLSGIQEDWSSVADLIRSHDRSIAIDMRVTQPVDGSVARSAARHGELENELRMLNSFPALIAGEQAERRATAFYSLLSASRDTDEPGLQLSVVLSSRDGIPELLQATILRELFGPIPTEQVELMDYPRSSKGIVLGPSQLIRVFHPPYGPIQGRGLRSRATREIPFAGWRMPQVGARLGSARVVGPRADRRVDVRLSDQARTRHIYVLGKTGTGKTNLLKEVCRQDIEEGRGLAVIDPHGELVDYLAEHCDSRLSQTVLLDYGDPHSIPLFNPLLTDVARPRDRVLHLTDFLRVLESRYYNEWTGPVFDDMVRQALDTLFLPEFPIPRSVGLVEQMYRNRDIRLSLATLIESDATLRDRWNLFESLPEKEKAERITWMLSKFADLLPDGSPLRLSLCSALKSPLSFDEVVLNSGVLLVKLPDSSIGSDASAFLGSLIIRRLQRAIFRYESTTGKPAAERPMFSLCIDEFQKFATAGLQEFVAEARKFSTGLMLAHQNLEQLYAFSRFEGGRSRELLNAIVGNVGTMITLGVGPEDREIVSRLLRVREEVLDSIPKDSALCRMVIDRVESPAFTLSIDDAGRKAGPPASGAALRDRMLALGYAGLLADVTSSEESLAREFASALSSQEEVVRRIQARRLQERIARLKAGSASLENLLDEVDPSGDLSVRFFRECVSAIVSSNLDLGLGDQDEVTTTVLNGILQFDPENEAADLVATGEKVVDGLESRYPGTSKSWLGVRDGVIQLLVAMREAVEDPTSFTNPEATSMILARITVRDRLRPLETVAALVRQPNLEASLAKFPEDVPADVLRAFGAAHATLQRIIAWSPAIGADGV